MKLLAGKTALITGGGTGVGFGIAQRFLEQGAKVLIAGRREDVLQQASQQLREAVPGAELEYRCCDITVEEQVVAAGDAAAHQGRLDICVANAGSGYPTPILHADAEAWRFCCELNIVGTALCIRHAGLAMKEHGGSILTISSVGGIKVEKWMAPYSVTKAGLEMLTRCAAVELASFGIRVNCIQPGYVVTESTRDFFPPELKESCQRATPLGRAGEPQEIGDGAVFLASDASRWVTGQVLGICGGMSIPMGEDFESMNRQIHGDELMDSFTG